jgi:uncharacterized membrane protein
LSPPAADVRPPAKPLPAARPDRPVLVRQHGHRPRHPRPGAAAVTRLLALGDRAGTGPAARPAAPARSSGRCCGSGWKAVCRARPARRRRLQHAGLHRPATTPPATNAVLLNSFIPIATITLSWAFLGKHLRGIEWLGVLLSFVGVTIIVCRGEVQTWRNSPSTSATCGCWLAVFTWALYTIGLQWRPAGVDPMLLLAAFTSRRPARPRPRLCLGDRPGRTIQMSRVRWRQSPIPAIFPGFLGYVFYNRAVAEVGASKASLFIHLMPVFGTLLSAIFLDEIPQLLSLPRHRPHLHRHLPDHRSAAAAAKAHDRQAASAGCAIARNRPRSRMRCGSPCFRAALSRRAHADERATAAARPGRGLPRREGVHRRRRPRTDATRSASRLPRRAACRSSNSASTITAAGSASSSMPTSSSSRAASRTNSASSTNIRNWPRAKPGKAARC